MAYKDEATRIAKSREYYLANKERIRARQKEYYAKTSETQKQRTKDYYQKNKDTVLEKGRIRGKRYREVNAQRISEKNARNWRELRERMFVALGGAMCVGCSVTDFRVLQADHINGGGRRHYASFSSNKAYVRYVIDNPEEFQVLCANCNWIKRHEKGEFRGKD